MMTDDQRIAFSLPPDLQSVAISDEDGQVHHLVVEARDPGPFEQSFIETGYYQPVARLLIKLLRSQGTLIDLGANIGSVCLPVALAGSRVVAVELLPRNAAKLRAAAQLNGVADIRVIQAAVTSSDGPVGFLGAEAWGHVSDASESSQTAGLRLDTILQQIRIEEPDFLQPPFVMKIDVEGHEFEALRGAEEFLQAHRPIFVFESIESAAEPPGSARRVKQFVSDLDYSMYMVHGRILSEYQMAEPQVAVVSDILAIPKEISLFQLGISSSYVIRQLAFSEQIALLEDIANHSPAHLEHAKVVASLFEQRLMSETQALLRVRAMFGMAPGRFPPLIEHGQVYDAMSTAVGRVDAEDGMRVFICDGSNRGAVAYGPYCPCAAGAYEATFMIKVAAAEIPLETEVAVLDTTVDGANGQSRVCTYGEFEPGVFTITRFGFELTRDAAALETRVILTENLPMAVLAAVAIARPGRA